MTPQMMEILHRISLLYAPEPETVCQQVAEAAREVYSQAMVMVNLVDGDCLRFHTVVNKHPAFEKITQLDMKFTLCQFALTARRPLLVQNAAEHPDFCRHPVVRLKLRRYLGVPICNSDGHPVGTLCFLDDQTGQELEQRDIQFLSLLAMRVSAELERERILVVRQVEQAAHQALEATRMRERQQYEADMARSKAFVECTADAVIAFDKEGRITDWNNGAARVFGYTAEEAIGRSYTLLGTPEVYDFQHRVFAESLRGASHQCYDTRRRHKDGAILDVSITTSPFTLDGERQGLVAIVRDITEKVRAAAALQERNVMLNALAQQRAELNARLQAQAEEKRHFVNMVIHDLRHPLTTMRTALYLLRIDTDKRQRLEHLAALENRTRALSTLLDELILYDQIEAGKPLLQIEKIKPETVIRACVAEVAGEPGADAVPIYCVIAPELGTVTLDAGKLRHILLNLLANALKFTSEGYITVRAAVVDEVRWRLEVEDTGIGMSSLEKQRAFEEYFSGGKGIEGNGIKGKGAEGGIGLGLAITRRLCHALSAEVTLNSTPGQGTHFAITLPRCTTKEPGEGTHCSVAPPRCITKEPGEGLNCSVAPARCITKEVESQIMTVRASESHRTERAPTESGDVAEPADQEEIQNKPTSNAQYEAMTPMRAVGMLATGIAHDLRNILTALRMEMAEFGPSPCKTSTARQVNRLYVLTHSLLALSEEETFHAGPVDLNEIVTFVFGLLREQAEIDGIALRKRIPCDLPLVHGNARRLEYLFVNLLRNALFALAPTGGTITVSVRRENAGLRVKVHDTGPGIPPENLPHLFEPFFTTQVNRTGLGLFSAKQIVEAHGGEIVVTSRRGRRACVSVWLPSVLHLETGGNIGTAGNMEPGGNLETAAENAFAEIDDLGNGGT